MLLMRWPTFRLRARGKRYAWEGTLQPTPLSAVYTVRIEHADWWPPQVVVVSPPLKDRGGTKIPHRYGDGSLCLNLPGEWRNSDFISDTVVPWTVHWLHHYEVWRVTGEWLGGGAHPTSEAERVRP